MQPQLNTIRIVSVSCKLVALRVFTLKTPKLSLKKLEHRSLPILTKAEHSVEWYSASSMSSHWLLKKMSVGWYINVMHHTGAQVAAYWTSVTEPCSLHMAMISVSLTICYSNSPFKHDRKRITELILLHVVHPTSGPHRAKEWPKKLCLKLITHTLLFIERASSHYLRLFGTG